MCDEDGWNEYIYIFLYIYISIGVLYVSRWRREREVQCRRRLTTVGASVCSSLYVRGRTRRMRCVWCGVVQTVVRVSPMNLRILRHIR